MQRSEYLNIYKNEETHFYYKANHNIILSLISRYVPQKRLKILDAGCGTGLLAKKLEKLGNVEGIDYSTEAVRFAKKRGVIVKQGLVDKLPYNKNTFDVVVCVDVINHSWVKNEQKALEEMNRVLKP